MSTKNVCWAPPGKPDDKHCTVETRADIVFFASSVQFSGNAADYFTEAQEYFRRRQPTVTVGTGDNLRDIIEGMNTAKKASGTKPFGDVHIVAHGSERAWLMRAIAAGTAGPTMEESDIWSSQQITVLDLLRIFLLQLDGKFPRLDGGVVDEFTRIIVYSCDLGLIPHMLDAISHVLGWSANPVKNAATRPGVTPQILAPTAWVFFRRPTVGADPEIRLFDRYDAAVIKTNPTPATFAPNAAMQTDIATQLKAIYTATDPKVIDDMVKMTRGWVPQAPANGWAELNTQASQTRDATILVDDAGNLSFIATRKAYLDDMGYVVPGATQTVGVTGVQESQLNAQKNEVFAQVVWAIVTRQKAWWNLRLWNLSVTVGTPTPAQPYVAANPFQGTSEIQARPKSYVLTATFSCTFVSYFVMRTSGGRPVDFDPDGSALVKSTYATRNAPGGFYHLDMARRIDHITTAGKALHDHRIANP